MLSTVNLYEVRDIANNVVKNIRRLKYSIVNVQCYDDDTLAGFCGVSSYVLYKVLHKQMDAHFVYGAWEESWKSHCWVEIGDYDWHGRRVVVDITARQFDRNLPEVLIVDRDNRYIPKLFGKKAIAVVDRWNGSLGGIPTKLSRVPEINNLIKELLFEYN